MMHTGKSMHQILSLSNDAYEEIFEEIDTIIKLKKWDYLCLDNKNLKSRELEIKVRNELGIEQKLLTQKEVLDLEPNLQLFLMLELFMKPQCMQRILTEF